MFQLVSLLLQFFSKLTERFVYGVDVLVDTFWRIWTDLLEVLGIDGRYDGNNLGQVKCDMEGNDNPYSEFAILLATC